jgi:hypothetical protein
LGTWFYYSPKRPDALGVLPTFTHTRDSSPWVKRSGREDNHWAVARIEAKSEWSFISTLRISLWLK